MFIKKATEILLSRDYRIVPKLCDSSTVGSESQYITFFKQSGVTFYGIVLINTALCDYKSTSERLREQFKAVAGRYSFANAYFIGIYIGRDAELKDYCTNDIDDYTAYFNEIRWIADTESKKIAVYGSQPDKIEDIGEIVKEALAEEGGGYEPQTELNAVIEKEIDNRRAALKSKNTVCTLAIIAINCLIAALVFLSGIGDEKMYADLGLNADAALNNGEYYRFISSMFLHSGIVHLMSNMLFLYIFGSSIEKYYGKIKFIVIYLLSGLVGGLVFCGFSASSAVGASGCVFGLAGAVLAYSMRIKRAVDGKDTYFMIMFVIVSTLGGFLNIDTANSAHIGGLLTGFVAGTLLCNKK